MHLSLILSSLAILLSANDAKLIKNSGTSSQSPHERNQGQQDDYFHRKQHQQQHLSDNRNATTTTTTTTAVEHSDNQRFNRTQTVQRLRSLEAAHEADPRIVRGQNAREGRFPYYVRLVGMVQCGGTLVAPDIVITAAHCNEPEGETQRVQIGIYDQNNYRGPVIPWETFLRHPDWVPNTNPRWFFDVGIVKLQEPVPDGFPYVRINLDNEFPADRQPVTMLGMGSVTDRDGDPNLGIPGVPIVTADILQETQEETIALERCKFFDTPLTPGLDFGDPITGESMITEEIFCSIDDQGGNDRSGTCEGDSGGPVIFEGETMEDDLLVASTSGSTHCVAPYMPDIGVRTSFVSDWIIENGCRLSVDPPDYWNCPGAPTDPPTPPPTDRPVTPAPVSPTEAPVQPTFSPTRATNAPTLNPTENPTLSPTRATSSPTRTPTTAPVQPTDSPSMTPTLSPTTDPVEPTDAPVQPTDSPSLMTLPPVAPTEPPNMLMEDTMEPTSAPAAGTESPAVTTAPAMMTEAPAATSGPVVPTGAPAVTTAPAMMTESPAATTAPAMMTGAPVVTTAPAMMTESPAVTTAPAMMTDPPAATSGPVVPTGAPAGVTSPPSTRAPSVTMIPTVPSTGEDTMTMMPTTRLVQVTILIYFDDQPTQTGWSLADTRNPPQYSQSVLPGFYRSGSHASLEHVFLERGQQYTFTISDSNGDGFCCLPLQGSYTVSITGYPSLALTSGFGNFGTQQTTVFTVPEAIEAAAEL